MSKVVLDASALLAFLNEEPGAERVEALLAQAVMSSVNLSEVITKLMEAGMSEVEINQVLTYLSCQVYPFEMDDAWSAAKLRPLTRAKGLSLGDRACLALAHKLGLAALTADRAWAELSWDIAVEVIR